MNKDINNHSNKNKKELKRKKKKDDNGAPENPTESIPNNISIKKRFKCKKRFHEGSQKLQEIPHHHHNNNQPRPHNPNRGYEID